ncbi:MAG: methylmalonyl-CoA mutase family protein, partial [SAR202 cluster bacterium]|nr:methylmalonyl-CoA mutase family protein [SAR202 cluster bacterium]
MYPRSRAAQHSAGENRRTRRPVLEYMTIDEVTTSMTINSTASTLLCLFAAVAQERGIGLDKLRGTIQIDVLKEYIARGTYIYPPKQSLRV